MNFPLNPIIFGQELSIHTIFEILAYFIGFRFYLYLRKKQGDQISEQNRWWIFAGALAGAFFGSKLLGLIENITLIRPENFSDFFQSKTIAGGLLGGLIGVELTKKIIGVKVSSGDLMTYPLILGIIIGRIGCFLTGVSDNTQGLPTNLPWGMDLGDGLKRHPTPLYEIIFLTFLWLLIFKLEKKLNDGEKFKFFLTSYLFFRFFVEFIKPVTPFILNLSAIQLACLSGLFYYQRTIILAKNRLKEKK